MLFMWWKCFNWVTASLRMGSLAHFIFFTMMQNGNTQNFTESDFRKKIFAQIWAKNRLKIRFFGLCGKLLHHFFVIFGKKMEWFFRGKFLFAVKKGFSFWGNSLFPFSCYQLFFLVYIYSSCSLHFLTLWQFFYFYLTFIIR